MLSFCFYDNLLNKHLSLLETLLNLNIPKSSYLVKSTEEILSFKAKSALSYDSTQNTRCHCCYF